jgi:hypothetical protein
MPTVSLPLQIRTSGGSVQPSLTNGRRGPDNPQLVFAMVLELGVPLTSREKWLTEVPDWLRNDYRGS